jgi:YcxB-like protein
VEIRYTWTSEDALNALRAQSVRGWSAFQFVLLLALLFLVGIYLVDHGFGLAGWTWLGASAVFAMAAYEVPRMQVRRGLNNNPSAQGEIVFRCDGAGTSSTYSTGKSQLEWRAYTRYKETDQLFLMFFSSGRCICLPKRVMSAGQIEELRGLLRTQILAK